MALKSELFRYHAPFPEPIETARGRVEARAGFVLSLERRGGHEDSAHRGLGEAACWPGFGSNDLEAVERALVEATSLLNGFDLPTCSSAGALQQHLAGLRTALAAQRALPPEAWAAVSGALLDLSAKERGRSLAAFLHEEAGDSAASHQLVRHVEAGLAAIKAGATALKVKVACAPLADEQALVTQLRAAVGPTVKIRLDANEGWSRSEAEAALEAFAPAAPEWVEAPFLVQGEAGIRALAALRQRSPLPLAADESLRDHETLAMHLEYEAADVYVLKPLFFGGLLETMAATQLIAARGARFCVTHGLGTQVERRGALHLAAALEGAGFASEGGLGGALSRDLAPASPIIEGRISLGAGLGLGLELDAQQDQSAWLSPVEEGL